MSAYHIIIICIKNYNEYVKYFIRNYFPYKLCGSSKNRKNKKRFSFTFTPISTLFNYQPFFLSFIFSLNFSLCTRGNKINDMAWRETDFWLGKKQKSFWFSYVFEQWFNYVIIITPKKMSKSGALQKISYKMI